jgi:hypothetical protein
MLAAAEGTGFMWPGILNEIRELFSDCGCAYAKNKCRKLPKLGTPEAVIPEENSYALELDSFGGKTYLSILDIIYFFC